MSFVSQLANDAILNALANVAATYETDWCPGRITEESQAAFWAAWNTAGEAAIVNHTEIALDMRGGRLGAIAASWALDNRDRVLAAWEGALATGGQAAALEGTFGPVRKSAPPRPMLPGFHSGMGTVPNSRSARSSILAIQGGADGKWQAHPTTGYPWFAAPELNFLVSLDDYQTADAAWEAVRRLDDETADTFMIACAQYIANRDHTPDGLVLITPDDVLSQRGIAKHKRSYKPEDREKAAQDFKRLGTITVEGHRDGWESTGRKGKSKRVRITLEGRLIDISVKARKEELSDDLTPLPGTQESAGFSYRLGPWAQGSLGADGSTQLAEMNQTIIQYHAKNQRCQKRIGRYLVWIFRIQRGGQNFEIRKLLAQSGIDVTASNRKNPGRFRDDIEKALNDLRQDGVIGSLEWVSTPVLPGRNWLEEWLCHTVHITPPAELLARYRRIGKSRLHALPDTQETA